MEINVYKNKNKTSCQAAKIAKNILIKNIKEKGIATFVIGTGISQLSFINKLTSFSEINWSKTVMFHLDEYIGITEKHNASFRNYLKKNFLSKIDDIGEYYFINGENNPEEECERINQIIKNYEIDVSFVGIGENGHLAFNDPPADLETKKPYIIVNLNKKCREQQVNEGWFDSIEEVPKKAITMSVMQIMKSKEIICTVPGARKAKAVKDCFSSERVSPKYPASILKEHKRTYVYLDNGSSKLINN